MKLFITLLILLSYQFVNAQISNRYEIGFITGVSMNNTAKQQSDYLEGTQFGQRFGIKLSKHYNVQFRSMYRSMDFLGQENYTFLIGPPTGQPIRKSSPKIDRYKTVDISLLFGATILSKKNMNVNVVVGGGRARILNIGEYQRSFRLEGLKGGFTFFDSGLELTIKLHEHLLFTINPQFLNTSIYRAQYGRNNSYQLNFFLSYRS